MILAFEELWFHSIGSDGAMALGTLRLTLSSPWTSNAVVTGNILNFDAAREVCTGCWCDKLGTHLLDVQGERLEPSRSQVGGSPPRSAFDVRCVWLQKLGLPGRWSGFSFWSTGFKNLKGQKCKINLGQAHSLGRFLMSRVGFGVFFIKSLSRWGDSWSRRYPLWHMAHG